MCELQGCMFLQEIASKAGIPRNSIFPLKNFHSEPEPSSNTGILILRALHEALNAAKDFHRDLILDSEGTSKEKVGCHLHFSKAMLN